MTVTGKTMAENLKDVPKPPAGQDLIVTKENCYKPFADMQICFGNLAPEGIVFKVSSMKNPQFEGKAVCFEDPRDIVRAVEQRKITPGSVIVLRNMGPVASGMPEVLIATAALAVPELDGKIAFISDARVSGVSHGAIGVHCAPEAAVGGPIGCVQDGDLIGFDLLNGSITVNISDDEMTARRSKLAPLRPLEVKRGYLADWSATVALASHGCVSKALHPECS
jgi:dihydroxy-acid dehydratase